ncbi:hypothetical protein K2Y00_03190 [Patescibacteria group bacterium]|nr:hypothetical protein [Patescibacteria group bacterium]
MRRGIALVLLGSFLAVSAPLFVFAEEITNPESPAAPEILETEPPSVTNSGEEEASLPELEESTESEINIEAAPEIPLLSESPATIEEEPENLLIENFEPFNLLLAPEEEFNGTIIYDFPTQVWGGPNEAFALPCRPYAPFGTTKTDLSGEWDTDVECQFVHWHDSTATHTFDRFEVYLGFAGISNLTNYPATNGAISLRIYRSDESSGETTLIAESEAIDASAVPQVMTTDICTGSGTTSSPYSSNCLSAFSFPDSVTLTQGEQYVFELYGTGLVTQTEYVRVFRTYYYPHLQIMGASVVTPPFGSDGVQDSPNIKTGVVYMRLLASANLEEPEGASSVLFLPGFLGSRLYTTGGRKLWEPNGSDDIKDLALNEDGSSVLPIYVGDTVDRIHELPLVGTIYGKLMEWLDQLETERNISSWEPYPYDWRYDVFDIVDNGTLKEDGTRSYLISFLEELALDSFTGKVTIIGHSNGGLLAKALMVRLEEMGRQDLVDKVILVGTPQVGTPQGMLGLLHGHNIVPPYIALNGEARRSAMTMPGAYALLPSDSYFSLLSNPLAIFESGTATDIYVAALGKEIKDSFMSLAFMLNDPFTRTPPAINDEETPHPLSLSLITRAADTHVLLDSWEAPEDVSINEIAGWGNITVTGAKYYTESSYSCPSGVLSCGLHETIDYEPITTFTGDDTVVAPSALFMESGVYFNLYRLSNDFQEYRKHENLTESSRIHEYFLYLFGTKESYNESLFSSQEPNVEQDLISVSVHSPVIISLTNKEGKKTGIFPVPDSDLYYIIEDIPNSAVKFGGEGKYIIAPATNEYEVSIYGIDDGVFTIKIVDSESKNEASVITNLPVTPRTYASTTIDHDASSISPLSLDEDGDGETDITIAFEENETVIYETPFIEAPIKHSSRVMQTERKPEESNTEIVVQAAQPDGDLLGPSAVVPTIKKALSPTPFDIEVSTELEDPVHQSQTASVYDAVNSVFKFFIEAIRSFIWWILGLLTFWKEV